MQEYPQDSKIKHQQVFLDIKQAEKLQVNFSSV